MTLSKILEMGLIKDDTTIIIRNEDLSPLTGGNWFQDNVLNYINNEIESFTWQDDNTIYIDIKEV